jgi:beta-glucanase (GH16 family)
MTDYDAGSRPTNAERRRTRWIRVLAVVMSLVLFGLSGCTRVSRADQGSEPCPPPAPLADEFNGPAGAPPNPDIWSYRLGGGYLEVQTDSPRNASLDGNGNLAINALKETLVVPPYPPFEYTSGNLQTLGKFAMCYGNLRARIRIPSGKGLRPMFWMLGTDLPAVGWPGAGEIDVIDVANKLAGSAVHSPFFDKADKAPIDITDDWHEFWLHWEPNKIVMGVDGMETNTTTPDSTLPFVPWVFNDHPMFVTINLAVGGADNGGPPDNTTPFPATMLVDWMRYTPL